MKRQHGTLQPAKPNESFTFDYNDKLGVGKKIIGNLLQKLEIVIK
jgi:hypothetical protein